MQWRNDSGLVGRSVVVTGAAGGIGRHVTRAFAEAGAHVVAVDIPGSPVGEVVASRPTRPSSIGRTSSHRSGRSPTSPRCCAGTRASTT